MPKTRPSLYLLWAGELLPEVCGASRAPDSLGTGCLYCGYCRNWAGDRWELCRCPVPQASLPPWDKMWGWDRALWVLWQDARSPEAMPVPASFTPPLWLVCAKLAQDGTRTSLSVTLLLWVRPLPAVLVTCGDDVTGAPSLASWLLAC